MDIVAGTTVSHILIVEDDRGQQALALHAFLDYPEQFRVTIAGNLRDARDLIGSESPDLIIADWNLPDGKGIDILPRKNGMVTIPLVIMTGYGDEHLAVEIMKSGALDYVVKSATMFEDMPHIARRALRDWENLHGRELAEGKVRDYQKRLADILSFLPDAVLAIDNEGRVIAWNNAIEQMTGVTAEAMLGKGDHEHSIPFYGERRPILIDLVLEDDPEIEKNYLFLQREGQKIISEVSAPLMNGGRGAFLWATASPLFNDAGERIGAIEVIRDITERKQKEELLQQREAILETLLNAPNDTIALLDRQGIIIGMNDEGARRLGGTVQAVTGRCVYDLLPAEVSMTRKEYVDRVFATGKHSQLDDARSGMYLHNEFFPIFNSDHTAVDRVAIFARDITFQKQAEQALQESETRFKALIQNSSDIIRILNQDGRIVYESPSSEWILGYPPGSLIGRDPMEYAHPEDLARVKNDLRNVYDKTNTGVPTEFRIRKADGEYLWVDSIGTNLLDVAGVNGIVITTRPIQQRKHAEEQMIASQRLYAVQSQISQAIVRMKDLETFVTDICRILVDYGHFRMSWVGLLDPRLMTYNAIAHAGHDDGYIRLLEISLNDDEKSRGPTGTAFKEKHYDICNDIETDSRMGPWRDEALKRGYHSSAAFPFRRNGEVVGAYTIYASGKNFFNETEIALLEEIAMNISFALDMLDEQEQRKRVEEALAGSEEQLRLALEGADAAFWDWHLSTGKAIFSNRFYTMLDYEPGEFPATYDAWTTLMHPDERDRILNDLKRQIQEKRPLCEIEYRLRTKAGDWIWILGRGKIVETDDQGNPLRFTGVNIDITNQMLMESEIRSLNTVLEQRVRDRTEALSKANEALESENAHRMMAEKKLQSSYDEKVVLLKEIHHRVKNNLQIIASLLNLQSRYISDSQTLAAIRESQNRVKAMALVHEKLYRADDIAHISLREYVRFLGTGLFHFYDARAREISFLLEIHDINVDIDAAIPIGLILNELISNSLKYAFPDGKRGEIFIEVKKEGHTLTVLFRDTGVGIPAEMDWRNTPSLGLRLVITLVDQMNGTVELDRSCGTIFTMVLHEKEQRSPE